MATDNYYRVLGLSRGCSIDEIKRAYRQKAREYHPDINPEPEARDLFIEATEAYEFLITNYRRIRENEEAWAASVENWKRYRQARARRRARAYSCTSFNRFRNTNFYKTTRIFNTAAVIASLAVAIIVLVLSVYGYFFRLRHPIPGIENPSVIILLIFIAMGMTLFIISFINLRIHQINMRKTRHLYEGD